MSQVLAFLGVAVLVIVTPGPDTAVTIRATLLGGRGAGMLTALGVISGQACWTVAASAGLTAVLVASEPAFLALKRLGATLRRPRVRRAIEAVTGAVLIALGVRVAAEPRPR